MQLNDALFGRGRSASDMRGVFAPTSSSGGAVRLGDLLATFKGVGAEGKGRERGLDLMERLKLVTPEQRAASATLQQGDGSAPGVVHGGGGAVDAAAGAVEQAAETTAATTTPVGAGPRVSVTPPSANPIMDSPYAQRFFAQHGIERPGVPVAGGGAQLVDVAPVVADDAAQLAGDAVRVADDAAAGLEQRLVASFSKLADLPVEQRMAALANAVDQTAVAGQADDAFELLAGALVARQGQGSIAALDDAVAALMRPMASAGVDDVARVAAPVADDVARAARPMADDALRHGVAGAMRLSAGIDDVVRMAMRVL